MSQLSVLPAALTPGRYVSQQSRLRDAAVRFVSEYPDVYGQAWSAARQILQQLTGKSLDPARVWWHRFSNAASSPRTFTGWRHVGTPDESMTLVQLVMQRFNAHDQIASDELQLYGGFYTDGPQHGHFDERNEVAMLPAQLLEKFWALDFAGTFARRVESFWQTHGQTFCELARVRLLADGGLAVRRGELSVDDLQVVLGAVLPLETGTPQGSGASVRSFDIGGHEALRIIRVVAADGRQILYTPGLKPLFQVCRTERQMSQWVRSQLATATMREHFVTLFLANPQVTPEQTHDLVQVLDGVAAHASWADRNLIDPALAGLFNQHDRVIEGDVFEHLREQAHQQTRTIAQALTSNADLRKQIWMGYLSTCIRMTGPFTVFAWPLALAVTGAGVASVGLNIDQALHGHTARQRKAGVIGAILGGIFVLFNLPLLVDAAASFRVLAAPASPAGAQPEEWIALQSLNHERLLSGQLPMQGIERNAAGETWILLDGVPQPVRFSSSLNTWLIFDPLNPFAFFEVSPVRLDELGQWQRLPALRLSGGMDAAVPGPSGSASAAEQAALPSLPAVESQFWNLYMQFNLPEEESLSMLAVDRQKAAINIRQLQPGDELETDMQGDRVLVDAWNNEYRVFRSAEGNYVGGRVTRYTEQEDLFNQYLRTGVAKVPNQVQVIEELLEDMSQIGLDNRVNLYRGGSGARGTSGLTFRQGHIRAGDVLVNTDFTSFSENPYVTRSFASSQAGVQSYSFNGQITFDDTSIVFELPAGQHMGATPIAAFSVEDEEAESLFSPGHYFEVQGIDEVSGPQYRFVRVQIREVPKPSADRRLYEMRTGLPFTREMYASRLGENGRSLVDRFFPVPLDLSPTAETPSAR